MATASTLETIARELLRELDLGFVIENAAISAIAAGSVTVPKYFQNTNYGSGHFRDQNYIITRMGAASVADNERFAGALTNTSGLLAHTGANYADTTATDELIEMWRGGVRRTTDVRDAINRALDHVYLTTNVALSELSDVDGDMALSTDTNWTDVLTPTTSAKSVVARRTPYGFRSYNLIGNAAGEGTQSATKAVRSSRLVKLFAIGSANVGTASLGLYDVTNSADLGTAITHTEEAPMLMEFPFTDVGSTCKEVAARLLGTVSASADIFWNQAWMYREGQRNFPFPSYASEHYLTPNIYYAVPHDQAAAHVWSADSMEFVPLVEGKHYRLEFNQSDAAPNRIHLLDECPNLDFQYPFFVQARRPYSDLGTLSAESDTTTCPLNLIIPVAKMELLRAINQRPGVNAGRLAVDMGWAQAEAGDAARARPVVSPARPTQRWGGVPKL